MAGLVAAGVGFFVLFQMALKDPITGTGALDSLLESELRPPSFPNLVSDPSYPTADLDWKVQTLEGQDFELAQLKGKTVFLNCWATWCGPCVAEMTGLDHLREKLRDEPVVFLCVTREDPKTVREFIEKKKFSLPVYCHAENLPSVFRTDGIPANFILSPSGQVVFQHVGSLRWDDPSCVDFLKRVMASK